MSVRTEKTSTDHHWNDRALSLSDERLVNISDLVQRELENEFLFAHLNKDDNVLEPGCGNGFLTKELRTRVAHVDAFDFSENMIESAKKIYSETNNRFFVDSILSGTHVVPPYDKVVCVRVLINLTSVGEQVVAIRNMASWLKQGGKLILVEGYLDGFENLNELRNRCSLPEIKPAAINFYSRMTDLNPEIQRNFVVSAEWHSGMFDFLTRAVYPLLVSAEMAQGPSDFHEKIFPLARSFNPEALIPFARVRGLVLTKV